MTGLYYGRAVKSRTNRDSEKSIFIKKGFIKIFAFKLASSVCAGQLTSLDYAAEFYEPIMLTFLNCRITKGYNRFTIVSFNPNFNPIEWCKINSRHTGRLVILSPLPF
jgi:hypothetical protein